MLPLFIALESTMLAGLEHRENQWRRVLVLPTTRWALYFGKLVVTTSLIYAASLVVAFGVCAGGFFLPSVQPALRFGSPVPWASMFTTAFEVASLAF